MMKPGDVFSYLLLWGLIGSGLLNLYVILVFRTGIVYTARHKDGTLKEKPSASGIANSLILLGCIVGVQVASNYFGLQSRGAEPSFIALALLNYALYIILVIYDSLVIDYLVIVKWRPDFLMIPEAMNAQSMRKHIIMTIPVAPVIGLVLTALSTWIAWVAFF
jgi:hypothetical protein